MDHSMGYCDGCQERRLLRHWNSHQGDTSQCGECRGLSAEAIREELAEHGDEPHHSVDQIAARAGAL